MSRATSPIVGVIGMTVVTVVAAAAVGATLHLSADAEDDRLPLRHAGGDSLTVSELRLRIRVDGGPIVRQPEVPYFDATGFVGGPTGPFNSAHQGAWRAGHTASLRIASTNAPRIDPGDHVTVTVATDAGVVAELETRAS